MNFKVFLLAASTIAVGLVELIVGGILPQIASDLDISIVSAGQLISVFCARLRGIRPAAFGSDGKG